MHERGAPLALSGRNALFLDLDGTLVELAPTPDDVRLDAGIIEILGRARDLLRGALAIVSGRKITDLDRIVTAGEFAIVAEHGALMRRAGEREPRLASTDAMPAHWLAAIKDRAAAWPGVLVEEKSFGVALHYRLAPKFAEDVLRLLQEICEAADSHVVLRSHMAAEIRPKGVTKGTGVARIMLEEPFRNRIPIFIGDDETDEDGIEAARALGGEGFRLGRSFLRDPSEVREWLFHAVQGASRDVF